MDITTSSSSSTDRAGSLSCWGRLKLKFPWTKRRVWSDADRTTREESVGCTNIAAIFRARRQKPAGGFRYDPLSYAQNFDEGCWDDDDEFSSSRRFSSRFAAPISSTHPNPNQSEINN